MKAEVEMGCGMGRGPAHPHPDALFPVLQRCWAASHSARPTRAFIL